MGYLCLVRHGQSEGQLNNLYSGQYDHMLTPLGMQQAEQLGQKLKKIPFNMVITSRLQRAVATSELILSQNLFAPAIKVENETFNERSYGILENQPRIDVLNQYGPKLVEAWSTGLHDKPPGGETMFALNKRVVDFWKKEVEQLLPENNILLVSHYRVMQCLVGYVDNMPLERITSLHFANAEYIMYEF